jgi:hypothetical protein
VNPDFIALLRALSAAEARFLLVGAYAVTFHSRPRATGDLDVWIARDAGNAARVIGALKSFGAPLQDLSEADLCTPDLVFQMGVPPRRIDLLTSITGVEFEEAWPHRIEGSFGELTCPYIGREALIRNKRALGRPRDLADLELLEDLDS